MKRGLITFSLLLIAFFGLSQEIFYDIRGDYLRPISKEKLVNANNLSEINPGYPASWVSGYISAEIQTTYGREKYRSVGKDDLLTADQKALLSAVDLGSEVFIHVRYKPEGETDEKSIRFSYVIAPDLSAEYPGGDEQLRQYIKEQAIDKIPVDFASELQVAKVKFNINAEGETADAHITVSSGDEAIDKLLLQTIQKMGKWKPAENAEGKKVIQSFELSVGNMIGC